MTDETRQDSRRPAKVAGDRDEAKALPEDVSANATGGPEDDLHHPGAADSIADSEAGAGGSSGRTEPLRSTRRGAPRPGR